ncbi:hypothetical protein ACVII0_000981 [Sinorhizobium meliloti]|nr:hypothetical protein SAMN04244575_06297 [Sinorhizobium meliloti]
MKVMPSQRSDVFGFRFSCLTILSKVVRYRLPFSQNVTVLQRGDMHEHVSATGIRRNETKAFVRVKKFHLACRHVVSRLLATSG